MSSANERSISLAPLIAGCATAALLGVVIGWWMGASTSPLVGIDEAECPSAGAVAARRADAEPHLEINDALSASWALKFQLLAELGELEALADEVGRQDLTASEAIAFTIDRLEGGELRTLTRMLSGLDKSEIAQDDDVRAFAGRLAEVTLAAALGEEEPSDSEEDAISGLVFATEEEIQNPHLVSSRSFTSDADRIHVMIPTADRDDTALMVRWARVDRPRLLQLNRVPLEKASNFTADSYGSGNGWSPGDYRVSIYSGDSQMTPLGSATFSVTTRDDS